MPATANEAGARGSDESAGVLISSDTFHCCTTLHSLQQLEEEGRSVELETKVRKVSQSWRRPLRLPG